ncbi:hypothetical protein GF312_22630 [Candidatus Poribacteria bacterium]|nr:hypothetical protein [Candidatus Poribacteria bacterium]
MKKTILAFGELLWDLLPTESVLGGAVCNFIYRVNSLGDRGILVSRLGKDKLGEKAFKNVADLGLNKDYLQWDKNHPTGTVPVSFDENNNPNFVIIPDVAYDYIEMTDSLKEIAPKADCICFGTLSQRAHKTRETLMELLELTENSIKLLDINLRKDCYNKETIEYSLEKADILKLNEDELYEISEIFGIYGEDLIQLCESTIKGWNLKYCVVTLGSEGALAVSDEGEKVYDPGYKIQLADSVGAGDAFTAGFAYNILRNKPLGDACRLGNIMGALVSTTKGATVPISSQQIESFDKSSIERIYRKEFMI